MWQEIIQTKRAKIFSLIVIVIILIITGISAFTLISRSGKIEVSINVQPAETKVFIDGNTKNTNNSTVFLTEGNHTVQAFLNDYLYYETTENINEYNQSIATILFPNNATSDQINNILGDIATLLKETYATSNQQLSALYPIINYLPYSTKSGTYNINFEFNDDFTSLKILVNIAEKDNYVSINSALSTLKEFAADAGTSLSSYNIIFNNHTNIFIDKFRQNSQSNPLSFLRTAYGGLENINIQSGQYFDDEYYYTTIEQIIPVDEDYSDYHLYHVILKKEKNTWALASIPHLILTTYNTPNVPEDILNLANNYTNWSKNE